VPEDGASRVSTVHATAITLAIENIAIETAVACGLIWNAPIF